MPFLTGLIANLRDVRHLGPRVLHRHLGAFKGDTLTSVHVPQIGEISIRYHDSDMAVVREVFVARAYDLCRDDQFSTRIWSRYRSIVDRGGVPVIVDAGANIGATSLRFSVDFPEARVIAIEPDPENVALLRRNIEGRSNCVVLEAAVGAERGFVSLRNGIGLSWAVRTERAERGVPVVAMADAFAASGGDTPFIVKIDIEGFEKDLFAANTGWIEECYVVIIEPHDWMLPGQFSSRGFQQAMAAHDFEVSIRGENLVYVRG